MTGDTPSFVQEAAPEPGLSTGARLKEARTLAGLSIDAVAQQLKLAPRQVQALEDDDFARLPGRTFVRGFLRNYARLVRLDPDAVLATLPEAAAAPSLDHPTLTPTTRVMGELPDDPHGKQTSARWAIPLALAAIVAIAVVYEFARPLAERGKAALTGDALPAAGAPAAPAPPTTVTPAETDAPPVAPAPSAAGETASSFAESGAPAATVTPAAITGDMPLVFVFRGTSWVEVKDAKGVLVLSTIGYPGATHAVGGVPPFEVVLGNAEAVTVTWHGAPFDTLPFVKQNVAKFTVK